MSAHDTPEVGSGETVGERVRCDTCGHADGLHVNCKAQSVNLLASPDPVQPAGAGEGLRAIGRVLDLEGQVRGARLRTESAEAALATALREKAEDRARVEAVEALARSLVESGSLPGRFIAESIGTALAIPTATGDE